MRTPSCLVTLFRDRVPMLYDVILVGFPNGALVGDSPAAALVDVFGIDREAAERMLENVPSIVKEGVSEVDARRYLAAFRYIGADARFRAHEESFVLDVATGSFEVAPDSSPDVSSSSQPSDGDPPPAEQRSSSSSWDVDTTPPAPRRRAPPLASDSQMAKLITDESELTPTGDEFEEWDPWAAESGVGEKFERAARERLQRTADAALLGESTSIEGPQNRSALLAQANALARIRAAALDALQAADEASELPRLEADVDLGLRPASPTQQASSGMHHVISAEELPPPPSPGPASAGHTEEISGLGDAAEREAERRRTSKGLKHTAPLEGPADAGLTSEDAAALMEARLAARARAHESANQPDASASRLGERDD